MTRSVAELDPICHDVGIKAGKLVDVHGDVIHAKREAASGSRDLVRFIASLTQFGPVEMRLTKSSSPHPYEANVLLCNRKLSV